MHEVAKRCLTWAAVLVAVGTLMLVYGADLVLWFQELVGYNAEPALHAFSIVTTALRSFAMPLAAALIGAAVVIQTLAPAVREREDSVSTSDAASG